MPGSINIKRPAKPHTLAHWIFCSKILQITICNFIQAFFFNNGESNAMGNALMHKYCSAAATEIWHTVQVTVTITVPLITHSSSRLSIKCS